jgi:hypothetical protein
MNDRKWPVNSQNMGVLNLPAIPEDQRRPSNIQHAIKVLTNAVIAY